MRAEDQIDAGRPLDPFDELRHNLKTPLTTIRGRAHLLARAVRRAPSLADEERVRMLDGLAAIDTAVMAMVAVIDAMRRENVDDSDDPEKPS